VAGRTGRPARSGSDPTLIQLVLEQENAELGVIRRDARGHRAGSGIMHPVIQFHR
jgi:superfamily II DNA/RNA helicase